MTEGQPGAWEELLIPAEIPNATKAVFSLFPKQASKLAIGFAAFGRESEASGAGFERRDLEIS